MSSRARTSHRILEARATTAAGASWTAAVAGPGPRPPRAARLLAIMATLTLGMLAIAAPTRAAASGPGWRWPLTPRPAVARAFEPPARRWLPGHRGVDLAGAAGQPVRAAGAGVVTFAGVIAGRGVLVVDHGALRTTYEPVAASVRTGVRVRAGDVIGLLSGAGTHCQPAAPCLHWGALRGQTYLNPLRLVWAGPARLLPVDPLTATPSPDGALSAPSRRDDPPASVARARAGHVAASRPADWATPALLVAVAVAAQSLLSASLARSWSMALV